ncbi:MAG: mandelate racemase/muconate lactonizing enzyme family protein [Treponema sp.]|jgi:galactonate dehydratase|nr:mandelate racemase/muconate lactonizing enzyme family protein [Treponema sp.]
MKITDLKVLMVNRFMYVKIVTDEGLTGVGECGAWGYLDAAAAAAETFKDYLIGKDPLQIEHHWQYMYRSFHFRGAAVMGALSAIDIALWDISGKYHNAPIYQLIGGKCRDKIRVYYHVGGGTTEELVACCKKAKELGYNAVGHLSPFLDEPRSQPYFETGAHRINRAVDRVRQIRETVGDDLDLCLELHRRMNPGEAIAFAHAVEKYTPFFLEDPIKPDNFDAMALIANRINVPIATGERIHTIQEFEMLLSRNAVGYVRTSVCLCGGITGTKKIAAIAEAHDALIVPHNPLSPVSTVACLQIAAAVENFAVQELPDHEGPAATERFVFDKTENVKALKQSDIVTAIPPVKNGFIGIPQGPGLGLELTENVEERFPYKKREVYTRLNTDGSICDQ